MSDHSATLALGSEPIPRLLLRYSLPAIAGMIVFSLYNIIDSIFIGQGVGALAISGLAVTFPLMNLTFACGMLIGVGGASISSIRLGAQDLEGATRVLGNVTILNVLMGVTFALLTIFFLDPILLVFGASPDTLPYARDFMQIILLGLPITYTMFGLNHLMRASGYPNKALISALVTVAVNIALAPVFIFWLGWGIQGAAFATVCAQVVGMLWVLSHFRNPASQVHFQPGIYRLRLRIITDICSIGMAPFLVNVCACAVVAVINTSLRHYGGDMAVGAYGIINRVLILFIMVVMGLTQGMQPIIGYNYGAHRMARVRTTLRYGIYTGGSITLFGMLIAMLAPEAIARMFTHDAALIAIAVTGLRLCTLVFPLVGIQIVIGNFFQSIGRAKIAIFLSLIRQLIFLIPCLVLLPLVLGLKGIWFSLPLSDCLAFAVSLVILRRAFKKKNRTASPTP